MDLNSNLSFEIEKKPTVIDNMQMKWLNVRAFDINWPAHIPFLQLMDVIQ